VNAVEFYRQVTADDNSAEGRDWDVVIPAADAAIAELESSLEQKELTCTRLRTSWREDTESERKRAELAEAELADLKSCHTATSGVGYINDVLPPDIVED
jgi:hypothetical protein